MMIGQDIQSRSLDDVDFFSPEVLADPYPLYARLRRERPVIRFHQRGFGRDQYIVTPYDLVQRVFSDKDNFSSQTNELFTGGGRGHPEAEVIYATTWPEVETMLTSDEPDHTRLRALASMAFTPKRVQRMADLIGQSITGLIDQFIERGECDFVKEFAVPLPIHSIAAILGIDRAYNDRLYDWTFSLMRRNGQMGTPDEQVFDARQVVEMKEFVAELVKQRRRSPTDDLISDLLTAKVDGASPFTDLELLSTVNLLIVGGAETTRSTLIAAMARLLRNPDQAALLRRDLSLAPKALDEVLRLDPPGTALWRIAKHDIELRGTTIPKGAIVMMRIDAANRDETVFADPDRFDILRPNAGKNLSFGAGIHFCIGFRLAREQINQSIPALLTRLENLEIDEEKSDFRPHISVHVRCQRALHLRFTPGRRITP